MRSQFAKHRISYGKEKESSKEKEDR